MKKALIAIAAVTMLILGATVKPADARWGWGGGWGHGWGWGPGLGLGAGGLGFGLGMGLGSEYYGYPYYTGYGGFYNGVYPYGYGVGLYSAPALYGSTCGACYY